jgi:hypothetical protein
VSHHNVHRIVLPDEEDGPGVWCPSHVGVCGVIVVNDHPICVCCYSNVSDVLPADYSSFIFDVRQPSAEPEIPSRLSPRRLHPFPASSRGRD